MPRRKCCIEDPDEPLETDGTAPLVLRAAFQIHLGVLCNVHEQPAGRPTDAMRIALHCAGRSHSANQLVPTPLAYSGRQYSSPKRGYISMASHPTGNVSNPCAMKLSDALGIALAGMFAARTTPWT